MKVIGEEGTHINDFIAYLKSEFLDYVYLQQNTFDKADAATSEERQQYVFSKVIDILNTGFDFSNKDKARRYFLELRQIFIDWNYAAMNSEQFKKLEAAIDAKVKEHIHA